MSHRQTVTNSAGRRLDRLATRAGLALAWERLWPTAAALLSLLGLFLAVSFFGLWLEIPRWGRISGVVLFLLAGLAVLASLLRYRPASRAEALARLDRDSGLLHRPATALEDGLANPSDDPATQALWDLHRQRAEKVAAALKVALPSPRLVEHDRYALRGLTLVLVVAAAFIAGPEKYARTLAAFDWRTPGALSQGYRIDAWLDPPAYTGIAPIVLNLRDDAAGRAARHIEAPAGSAIIVRTTDEANVAIETTGALVAPPADETTAARTGEKALRWSLKGDGRLVIKRFGTVVAAFDLVSVPDHPPVIALKGEPRPNLRGTLTLGYTIADDYGVIGAEATFASPVIAGHPVTGRSLVPPPKMGLALPSGPGGLGEAETTIDLSDHPWAGAHVAMTLSARDEGGNEGLSDPIDVTLPQRAFTKPLARALVEQRRNLALAPDDRSRVLGSIRALMIAPERFGTSAGVYLGLRSIANRLVRARTDPDLLGTADFMWDMALLIEDGGLSDAERELRAAQQQLQDALQRGAPDDEIRKLADQMRAALDKFLNELAQQAQRNGEQDATQDQPNANSRMITPQDLKSMIDRMEEMMRNGQVAEAQRMLQQLQKMLENLQTARRQRGTDPMAREMNQALDELDQMTRDQQALRDKTFRDDADQPDSQDPNGGKGDRQSLQQRQQALRQKLEQLQKRMKELGMNGEQGFADAQDAMKEAEGELGKPDDRSRGKAVDAQGRAIEGLRRGAQSLAEQMQQGDQFGAQGGQGQPDGPMRQGRDNGNSDPLGRESHDRRDNSRTQYNPLGTPAAQRAQQVLEELRRRLGDPSRPRDERDYLERLLKRY